jgi:lysophospholipase L1-like esterase
MTRAALAALAALGATTACLASGEAGAAQQPFRYLSLGDSTTVSVPSFVAMVADRAEAALRRKVTVRRFFEENTVAALERTVASSPGAVRTADLITIAIGVNQVVHVAFSNGCAGSSCAQAEREFEHQYASLLDRLTALRPASEAAYRLLTEYNLPGVLHGRTAAAFTAALEAENRFVCAQARARGMRCVDVYGAFNGAGGTRDPVTAGLVRSDNHPTEKGAALIASLIAQSGFKPS